MSRAAKAREGGAVRIDLNSDLGEGFGQWRMGRVRAALEAAGVSVVTFLRNRGESV